MRQADATRSAVLGRREPPPAAVLTNGRYATIVTQWGTGGSFYAGNALTRWHAHPARDQDAYAIYVRDLDRNTVYTVGLRPAGLAASRYEAIWCPGAFVLERTDGELEIRLEIAVAPDDPVEMRRCTVRNLGNANRRIELTSYLEVVLQRRLPDLAHPAFSKLFVETEWAAAEGLLLARRRPRSAGERPPWLAHGFLGEGEPAWETDRARFLGRGRSRARPVAMEGPLTRSTGPVLDPILSLRREFPLGPREEVVCSWILVAGPDREAVTRDARLYSKGSTVAAGFRAASGREIERLERHGVDAAAAAALHAAWVEECFESGGSLIHGLFGDARSLPPYGPTAARFGIDLVSPPPLASPPAPGRPRGHGTSNSSAIAAFSPIVEQAPLVSFNGYGGFNAKGDEYTIRIRRDESGALRLPPTPWINVLANEQFGCLVSETGSQHTWRLNSREHRLTPWNNDPVLDEGSEAIYLQDEESEEYWSIWASPAPAAAEYEVRHGFGYTICRHRSGGLEHEVRLFTARRDPVKVTHLRLTNPSAVSRKLALISYQELVPGSSREGAGSGTLATWDEGMGALGARPTESGPYAGGRVFSVLSVPGLRQPGDFVARPNRHSSTGSALGFLGASGTLRSPAALDSPRTLGDAAKVSGPSCLAQRATFELAPGESAECVLLFGEAEDAVLPKLVGRLRDPGGAAEAEVEVEAFWRDLLSGVRIETPSPVLDRAVNGWLAYQAVSCRLWARTAFYQSGGAFGFRDQIQDASALVGHAPDLTRAQLLLHAAHQFSEGDVLHWWHPGSESGLRTRFADDLLWLPHLTAHYVGATGDEAVLDELVGFLRARALKAGEDEAFLTPEPAGEVADLYEHCVRALDRSLALGPHGLPLFGSGDWNDSMNRVGHGGRGESVWMGFFLATTLQEFLPICLRHEDTRRASLYAEHVCRLRTGLETAGWDGAWYRRGYYDDGSPLGSKDSDECRIDALVQAWSVLSGVVSPERTRAAMAAVTELLICPQKGLIRLLQPPFDKTPHDPGYIKGYLPGVRENGGQYTHAALWVVKAFAELGRAEEAAELLEMLLPESHSRTPDAVERYQAEPYAIAGDVYGASPHVGRGGWTWYTGSAGWALRVALESVLGFRLVRGEALEIRPCIPAAWPSYRLEYRVPRESTRFIVTVRRGAPTGGAVRQAWLDGEPLAVEGGRALVPLRHDGLSHRVGILLGE